MSPALERLAVHHQHVFAVELADTRTGGKQPDLDGFVECSGFLDTLAIGVEFLCFQRDRGQPLAIGSLGNLGFGCFEIVNRDPLEQVGNQRLLLLPKVPEHGCVTARHIIHHWHARKLNDTTLNCVHQAEIAHYPAE